MSQTADSLVVAAPQAIRTALATESIARVRRSDGRSHGRGAWQGLKIGAAIGGGAMALMFGVAYLSSSEDGKDATFLALAPFAGALGGAMYGVVIGALVGAERWTTVYSMPALLSYMPGPTGAPGIGVAIRF